MFKVRDILERNDHWIRYVVEKVEGDIVFYSVIEERMEEDGPWVARPRQHTYRSFFSALRDCVELVEARCMFENH